VTIEDATIGMADSVALLDQMLAAAIHGLLYLLPEAGRDQVGGTAPDQPVIEPGRAVSPDLVFKIEARKYANVDLAISPGIIGRGPALKILRETRSASIRSTIPARRSASSRRTWASMKPSWSPPGTRPSNRVCSNDIRHHLVNQGAYDALL
jgi:hypothetical protein